MSLKEQDGPPINLAENRRGSRLLSLSPLDGFAAYSDLPLQGAATDNGMFVLTKRLNLKVPLAAGLVWWG